MVERVYQWFLGVTVWWIGYIRWSLGVTVCLLGCIVVARPYYVAAMASMYCYVVAMVNQVVSYVLLCGC